MSQPDKTIYKTKTYLQHLFTHRASFLTVALSEVQTSVVISVQRRPILLEGSLLIKTNDNVKFKKIRN